jgi:hypothetical protein
MLPPLWFESGWFLTKRRMTCSEAGSSEAPPSELVKRETRFSTGLVLATE